MIQAIVAVFPVPVAPSRVWKRSPACRLCESSSIAFGWSATGRYASDVLSAVAIRDRLAGPQLLKKRARSPGVNVRPVSASRVFAVRTSSLREPQ